MSFRAQYSYVVDGGDLQGFNERKASVLEILEIIHLKLFRKWGGLAIMENER